MEAFSPCRRRVSPPSRRFDSTPMLMSARSEIESSDIIGPDGRIVLTPTRAMSLDLNEGEYEEVATPLNDTVLPSKPVRASSSRRVVSKGLSEPLIMGGSSQRQLDASHSYRSAALASTVHHSSGLTKRAVRMWHFVANVVIALCLLAAVILRVNAVSAVYLLVLCYGVLRSFSSGPLAVFIILVSAIACIGHILFAALLQGKKSGWSGEHTLEIIGFVEFSDAVTIVTHPALDVLVLFCSVIHYFVVLRRLQLPTQDGDFDLFEAGAQLLQQDGEETRRSRRMTATVRAMEWLCLILLFLTSFSVPAGATVVFYVAMVFLLVSWTVYAKRISVEEFSNNAVEKDFLVGSAVSKALLVWCVVVIVAWYTLLFPDIVSSSIGRDIIKYAGFADFRDTSTPWQYYVFASLLALLFMGLAKLVNLHSSLKKMVAMSHARFDETSGLYHLEASHISKPGLTTARSGSIRVLNPPELAKLLREIPLYERIFLRDGGSLVASAAAIAWCVSYPSYASAPMMGWAFITIFFYGLVESGSLVKLLIFYGTLLSMIEYSVNLTWDFVSADYTKYGLRQFQYPFVDLGVHNFCLLVMYASMRSRWRYEAVVNASKVVLPTREHVANTPDGSARSPEVERSSMDAFRHLVDLRRGAQASWRKYIPLWIRDAKQVFLTHLGVLVLLTIVAVALSTRESFFQAGYLLLAMICIIFFKRRQKLWRVLLFYALAVCLAAFVRNVDCKEDSRLELIGLACYNANSHTWGALWPTLFSAQLIIILQLVFQLVIYVTAADTIDERMRTIDLSHQNPIFFLSRIAVEIDNIFRIFGGLVCYFVILAVIFKMELIDSGAHTTVLGGVQLVMLLIVIGGHLGKFKSAPRSSLRLKILWSVMMIVEVIILIARYAFHFKDVSNYFEKHLFSSGFMSARDFGFEKQSSKNSISGVFVYLAPTALLIGLIFWQLSSIMQEVRVYEVFVAGRSKFMDRLLFWMDTVRRVLIAFSTTALIVVTTSVAIIEVNAVGAAYMLILVVGRPLSSWQKLWFPLFWVSVISIAATYAYQFRLFGGFNTAGDGFRRINVESNAKWFGLTRLREEGAPRSSSLWRLSWGPLLVLVMCFVQRMAQYFEMASKKAEPVFMGLQHTNSQASTDRGANSGALSPEQVLSPSGVIVESASTRTPASAREGSIKLQQFMAQQGDDGDSEADFFSLMRDFCIEYAGSASVNVVMLLLTASAFVHRDVISIVYLLVVYGMMYSRPENVCKAWFVLVMALSAIIVAEYTLIVWLPPVAGVERERTSPWKNLSAAEQQWLALGNQHKWAVLADFVALLSAYMLPNSQRLRAADQHVEVRVQSTSMSKHSNDDGVYSATMVKHLATVESEFMQKTKQSAWHALVYFFILAWLPVTLVVIFICGAGHGGIASFVYIGGAVFMLYRLDDARLPDSKWIHQLRKFNWVHLFIMVIISVPYVKDDLSRCLVGANASDESTAGDVCLSMEGLLGVETTDVPTGIIAIFVLISIQCEMLSTPTYRDVCQYIQIEKLQASARQAEIIRRFYRDRTAQWFKMKKEKSAALQRLKMIVSKLVHKVEELMDIAMGLHYNLPPMAPSKPRVMEYFQNAVTLEWDPPKDSVHKIRFYRITRQQYPSQTLLGDFGDVVEVKGDITSMKIEGLRPGTSYQFKVAAVSRMGEGPFSSASDPASTYPLNLDGSCTAGWMKYRRENVAKTWSSTLLSWIQPKYLHRYVVIDARGLVFYKDEEIALRHRSKRRRKKIKTSFLWRDVVMIKLSDVKVQFDDVSPLLFCFELIVRQEGNDADLKYVFQVDVAKDFDRFLSALAFSLPLYTLDDSILQCLREKKLPVPEPKQGDGNEPGDEVASEISSATGDESSFGDAEDAEFDEQARASWRIPLYRFLYDFQDAAMQTETTVYDADDQVEPTFGEIVSVTINAIRSRTAQWCYIVMILAFARQADFLNFLYVVCIFGYLAIESPRPSSHSWLLLLKYTCVVILVRYVFQLPIFCQGLSAGGFYYPSFQPFCGAPKNSVVLQERSIQPSVVFGIFKFDGVTLPGVDDIFQGLQWNFYVAIAILWHRRELIVRGLWVDATEQEADGGAEGSEFGSRRHLNGSEMSSRDSLDESFNFGGGVSRYIAKTDAQKKQNSMPSTPQAVVLDVDSEHVNADLERELAEQILQELETEEEELQQQEQEREAEEEDPQRRRTSGQPDSTTEAINGVVEQIEMEESAEATITTFGKQKESWLEVKLPQVHAFFDRVICVPPVRWDKDIHAAVAGAKPGRDYFAASLSIMLFAAVFAVIFFKPIGDPDSSASGTAAQVKSSSMVSGNLVLIVFIQLCFIIWDRAAYVMGSLKSKIVLQYSYIVLLHLCVWVLMPQHIGIYFQQRGALVLFYLLHCVYLWLGALQIRYGYPVFKGSRYNYTATTSYQSAKEKVFPLVMLAPFLFEMRALLDYVCTKTSLSWQHWVLLEDTAAHLFQVKMEMRGRVEEAEVLQGKKRQPMPKKLMSAGVMLLFLLLCLIGPLLLFSSANPSTTPNRVKTTDVVLGIEDSRGTVNRLYSGEDINSPDYEGDQIAESAAVQRITYDTFSREVWSSSPPNVDRLVSQLESSEKLSWILTLTFVRPGPTDHQTIDVTHRVELTAADRAALVPMIQLTTANRTEQDGTPIRIAKILPSVVELTATSGVYELSTQLRSVDIAKHSVQGSSWWSVTPVLRNVVKASSVNDREFCDETLPFCLIAVSDNIVQGLTALGIGSYGITAVYIFVLVTVGSAVKGFFRGALFQIQYSELPDPDDVLELVEGIYIARSERYVGHLKDEVRIFETLIRVLRSPETLSKVTGTNVIHIPKAKEKVD